MQRLAGNFMVNRVVMLHIGAGDIAELYELPNGQWQFGKGRDARVVASLDDVKDLDEGTKKDVAAWLEKVKVSNVKPVPMQAGVSENVTAESARVRLQHRLDNMSPEMTARLLLAIENTLGPAQDSMNAGPQINSHADGYGDPEQTFAPGNQPFSLPAGAVWADERTPAAGYYTHDEEIKDGQGNPTKRWHPTPQFHEMASRPETGSTLDPVDPLELELAAERQKNAELVGSGSSRSKRARK